VLSSGPPRGGGGARPTAEGHWPPPSWPPGCGDSWRSLMRRVISVDGKGSFLVCLRKPLADGRFLDDLPGLPQRFGRPASSRRACPCPAESASTTWRDSLHAFWSTDSSSCPTAHQGKMGLSRPVLQSNGPLHVVMTLRSASSPGRAATARGNERVKAWPRIPGGGPGPGRRIG
jgi:hypothetical protein